MRYSEIFTDTRDQLALDTINEGIYQATAEKMVLILTNHVAKCVKKSKDEFFLKLSLDEQRVMVKPFIIQMALAYRSFTINDVQRYVNFEALLDEYAKRVKAYYEANDYELPDLKTYEKLTLQLIAEMKELLKLQKTKLDRKSNGVTID